MTGTRTGLFGQLWLWHWHCIPIRCQITDRVFCKTSNQPYITHSSTFYLVSLLWTTLHFLFAFFADKVFRFPSSNKSCSLVFWNTEPTKEMQSSPKLTVSPSLPCHVCLTQLGTLQRDDGVALGVWWPPSNTLAVYFIDIGDRIAAWSEAMFVSFNFRRSKLSLIKYALVTASSDRFVTSRYSAPALHSSCCGKFKGQQMQVSSCQECANYFLFTFTTLTSWSFSIFCRAPQYWHQYMDHCG